MFRLKVSVVIVIAIIALSLYSISSVMIKIANPSTKSKRNVVERCVFMINLHQRVSATYIACTLILIRYIGESILTHACFSTYMFHTTQIDIWQVGENYMFVMHQGLSQCNTGEMYMYRTSQYYVHDAYFIVFCRLALAGFINLS